MTFPKSQRSHAQREDSDPFFCCGDAHRIPALLAIAQPQRQAEEAGHTAASRGRLLKEEGQPALGGPSVWPSVTSQKQTVPSGYAANVPKITEVRQRQQEGGLDCGRLLAPGWSQLECGLQPSSHGPRANAQKANVRGLRSGSQPEPWRLSRVLGTLPPFSVPHALLPGLSLGLLCGH